MSNGHHFESGEPVTKSKGTPKSVFCVVFFLVLVILGALVAIAMHIYTIELSRQAGTVTMDTDSVTTVAGPMTTPEEECFMPEEASIEQIDLVIGEVREVTSPCFPSEDDAPPGITMVMKAPEGYRIKISFKEFRFDAYGLNRVLVGNGDVPRADSSIIGFFEGYDLPPDVVTRGNAMWVEMFAPYYVLNGAMKADVSVVTDQDVQMNCTGTSQPCRYALQCFTEEEQCNGGSECPSGTDEIGCECHKASDFKCADGQCVPRDALCNMYPTCDNDNVNCTFMCPQGFNISTAFLCDGVNDCGDHADEQQNCACDNDDRHMCPSGECIYQYNVCDGFEHCSDGSDEENCVCQSWEVICQNNDTCKPWWTRCDGVDDCGDNSDEENCRVCGENFFDCGNQQCLEAFSICDGYKDCYDGQDEENCPAPELCAEGEFQCDNGRCLREALKCDYVEQCEYGEDEDDALCNREPEECYQCDDGTDCIPLNWVCDDYPDCSDFDDEEGCDSFEGECEEGYSVCPNRSCIANEYVCNGILDCPGDVDESNCTDAPDPCASYSVSDYFVCDGKDDCPGASDEANCSCGTKPITQSRVLGGQNAVKGHWPWQILTSARNFSASPICGGTILNRRWILTAAHCVTPFSIRNLYVLAGVTDTEDEDTSTWQSRLVIDIVWNPEFTFGDYFVSNDNALLHLDKPLDFNDYVQPACLPDADFPLDPGTYVTAVGWGQTGGGYTTNLLQTVRLPVWPNEICDKYHYMTAEQVERVICTGYEKGGHGLCFGDSGGSVVAGLNNLWYSVGSVSGGIECGAPFIPGLVMRVPYYRQFILDTMRNVK